MKKSDQQNGPDKILQFKQTLDDLLEGCQIIGHDWKYIYINKEAEIHNKRPKEELIGKTYMDMWPGIEKTEVFKKIRNCLVNRTPQYMEYLFTFPDGTQGWFELRIRPVPEGVFILSIDITDRKEAIEKTKHLNKVLLAIRNINQLIIKEKNRSTLIRKICEHMTKTRGYYNAWILVRDENGNFIEAAQSGMDTEKDKIASFLEGEKLPHCIKQALSLNKVITIKNPAEECTDCPISHKYVGRSGIVTPLSYNGKIHGFLVASIPKEFIEDGEEIDLFREIGADIAYGLNDIILRKKHKIAEDALREAEHQFHQFFDNNPGYCYFVSKSKTILDVNKAALKALGYKKSEIVGKSITTIYAPESQKKMKRLFNQWLKTGLITNEEMTIVAKSGKKRTVLLSANKVIRNGEVDHSVSIQIDITERKGFETALKKNEMKFRDIFNNVNDAIFIHDLKGRILEVNELACKRLHYERGEMVGMNLREIDDVTYRSKIVERIEKVISAGHEVFETEHLTKEGKKIPVEINARLIEYEGKQCILSVVRDISDRKEAEEKIEKELKEKTVLLEEIHHRVKNNLQTIAGLLSLQADAIETKEDAIKGFEVSQDRIQSMAQAYDLLLGKEYLSVVSVGEYIQMIADNLKHNYAYDRQIDCEYTLDEMYMNTQKLSKLGLLINEIITNALKYAFRDKSKGTIRINLKTTQDTIQLQIADDGIGMAKDVDTEDPKTLGLQLVNMICAELKGTCQFEVKNGTRFSLEIPRNEHTNLQTVDRT